MTPGEIHAVINARLRAANNAKDGLNDNDLKELYDDLKAAKNG